MRSSMALPALRGVLWGTLTVLIAGLAALSILCWPSCGVSQFPFAPR